MSRRTFVPKDRATEVAGGYDAPMESYFVQVVEPDAIGRPQMRFWVGADRVGEIPTLADFLPILERHAEVSIEQKLRLAADRVVNSGLGDWQTPAEELVKAALAAYPEPEKALVYLMARTPNPRPASRVPRLF